MHKVRAAALVVDVSYSYSGGRRAAFPFLTHSLSSLPRTSTSLVSTEPCLSSPNTIALTFIYHKPTSFTSSPPAPNPLARAHPLQSWEQHGTGTQHFAHHHLQLQLLVYHPSILATSQSLPYVGPATPSSTTLPSQYQRIARTHSTSPAHNVPEDAGAASASPTAARRQLRVARSYSLRRPRTTAPTRARPHSNGAASAEQVGNLLENSEAVCLCFWHTRASYMRWIMGSRIGHELPVPRPPFADLFALQHLPTGPVPCNTRGTSPTNRSTQSLADAASIHDSRQPKPQQLRDRCFGHQPLGDELGRRQPNHQGWLC